MSDETQVTIAKGDLRRLYAKINAHECIIRALVHAVADTTKNPSDTFENLRANSMEDADSITRSDSTNADFVDEGRLETLSFVADFFAAAKRQREDK